MSNLVEKLRRLRLAETERKTDSSSAIKDVYPSLLSKAIEEQKNHLDSTLKKLQTSNFTHIETELWDTRIEAILKLLDRASFVPSDTKQHVRSRFRVLRRLLHGANHWIENTGVIKDEEILLTSDTIIRETSPMLLPEEARRADQIAVFEEYSSILTDIQLLCLK